MIRRLPSRNERLGGSSFHQRSAIERRPRIGLRSSREQLSADAARIDTPEKPRGEQAVNTGRRPRAIALPAASPFAFQALLTLAAMLALMSVRVVP
jgi:hypothetical protein